MSPFTLRVYAPGVAVPMPMFEPLSKREEVTREEPFHFERKLVVFAPTFGSVSVNPVRYDWLFTNAVVAMVVELSVVRAVGAVGVPVRAGEARSALLVSRVLSCVWMLLVVPMTYPSSVRERPVRVVIFPLESVTRAEVAERLFVRIGEIAPVRAAATRALLK